MEGIARVSISPVQEALSEILILKGASLTPPLQGDSPKYLFGKEIPV